MTELLDDIAEESALVGVAVTEIAVLHAELGGLAGVFAGAHGRSMISIR